MSKMIDKAFAKAYARRRPAAGAPHATPVEIERAEQGADSPLPSPHLGLSSNTMSSSTAEAVPSHDAMQHMAVETTTNQTAAEIDPDLLHQMLCSVTDVVATTWTTGTGLGLPELPDAVPCESTDDASHRTGTADLGKTHTGTPHASGAASSTSPAASQTTNPGNDTLLSHMAHPEVDGTMSGPAIEPPREDAPSIADEHDLLEGLKRAVDAVKQTDERLRRTAAASQMFVPLWEVDRFEWPDVVLRLERHIGTELKAAAEGMLLASCRGIKTLGVTALTVGRGTSTITLLLAKALIGIGGKVAMVDAAGTLAGLAELCGIEAPYGWNTALVEGKPLEEGATLSTEESSVVVSWSPDATDSLARLPGDRLEQAWKRLQATYDMTLVDLPPVDAGAVEALARHRSLCDALLLVRTPADDGAAVEAVVKQIRLTGREAVGIVENGYMESAG